MSTHDGALTIDAWVCVTRASSFNCSQLGLLAKVCKQWRQVSVRLHTTFALCLRLIPMRKDSNQSRLKICCQSSSCRLSHSLHQDDACMQHVQRKTCQLVSFATTSVSHSQHHKNLYFIFFDIMEAAFGFTKSQKYVAVVVHVGVCVTHGCV